MACQCILFSLFMSSCKKENEERIIIMHVAPYTVPGTNILSPTSPPTEHLYVDEEGDNEEWKVLPLDAVQGFQYEAGYKYTLQVLKYKINDPPQDGSSVGYKLLKIILKEKQ